MRLTLCATLATACAVLAACDEVAVANDSAARADTRAQKSCIRAVSEQTGAAGVSINTAIPVVELNRHIVDVPGGNSWVCATDDTGAAREIVERTRA